MGELILGSYKDKLCLCDWRYRKMRATIDKRIQDGLDAVYMYEKSEVIQAAVNQLEEYFNKERTAFDVPLLLVGTNFQKEVWNELKKIPFGETDTYSGLSVNLQNEKAIRAVASANGANAISIIVPCHRIVGSNGELVGYAGGIEAKKKLLELESGHNKPKQLSLFDELN